MRKISALAMTFVCAVPVAAENIDIPASWGENMRIPEAERAVVFATDATGVRLPVLWGFDTAWNDRGNIVRGVRYAGSDAIGVARVSFQPWAGIAEKGVLPEMLRKNLMARMDNVALIGKKVDIALNLDGGENTVREIYGGLDSEENYVGDKEKVAEAYAMLIDATAAEVEKMGYRVVSAAPFNEPDYFWNGTPVDVFHAIDRCLKDYDSYPRFRDIRISGGNTLNCDQALPWYDTLKEYLDEGNTHQLAGDFDHYADFFKQVRADGKHATADELHNVMEAMVGAEYGMQTGIWWGTAEQARGEFCKASEGERLAYAENRQAWSAASVYRNPQGEILGFLGCSERQAKPSAYKFVSRRGAMFFDGYGPAYEYAVSLPGDPNGAYQSQLQRNAETMVRICNGEDVPPYVSGEYAMINGETHLCVSGTDGSTSDGTEMIVSPYSGASDQIWTIGRIPEDTGGDFSYYFIRNTASGQALDDLNWNIEPGGKVISYSPSSAGVQQWALEYDGDGWFHVRNKQSALYLEGGAAGAALVQNERKDIPAQRWRLLPAGALLEFDSPSLPAGLDATPAGGSVTLKWSEATDANKVTYNVLRKGAGEKDFVTIARGVEGESFRDNCAVSGTAYTYKVVAYDAALNRSGYTEEKEAALVPDSETARLTLDGSLDDMTGNGNRAVTYQTPTYRTGPRENTKCLYMRAPQFVQLPYALMGGDAFTVAFHAKYMSPVSEVPVFSTGISETESLSLKLSEGGMVRLASVNGAGSGEIVAESAASDEWAHYAMVFDGHDMTLFINGAVAGSADFSSAMPRDRVLTYLGRSTAEGASRFVGSISGVRVFNHALNDSEVKSVMNAGLSGMSDVPVAEDAVTVTCYDMHGRRVDAPLESGVTIVREVTATGTVRTRKIIR